MFHISDYNTKEQKKLSLKDSICRVILRFLQLCDAETSIDIGFGLEKVKCVSFNGVKLHYPKDIKKIDIGQLTERDVLHICYDAGYRPVFHSKTDITVNGHNLQIRCQDKTDRPLINHTTRDKYMAVCEEEGLDIKPLDKIVENYWQMRSLGIINEDVSNQIEYSPFRNHKEYLKPIFSRMFFDGIAPKNGLSADILLDYDGLEPWNCKTWHPYTRSNYIDYVWEHLRFSFRADRGMPKTYNPSDDTFRDIKPWAHEWKDKKGKKVYKGALHIRVANFDSDNPAAPVFITKNADTIQKIKANKGEFDEMIIKIFFVEARIKKMILPIGETPEIITSVGMKNHNNSLCEFNDLPFMGEWNKMSVEEIYAISRHCNIVKANSSYKADVMVNHVGVSLKSQRGAAPSIINTTMRSKIKRVMDVLHQPMTNLDSMIDKYWNLRLKGIIGEDITNNDLRSPFLTVNDEDGKKYLEPLLSYFAFDGTGSKDSPSPAKYVLEFDNPVDISTWTCYNKDNYINSIFFRLVFSIRNHNMPKPTAEDVPWIKKIDGREKGQLNVRVAK
jgi:hypothetical protein